MRAWDRRASGLVMSNSKESKITIREQTRVRGQCQYTRTQARAQGAVKIEVG